VAILQYHVFKKPKKLKGGKSRQEAGDYIRTLPAPPRITVAEPAAEYNSSQKARALPLKNPDMLVSEIAQNMFIPGSAHVKRRQQLN
jgi:hypothetical protein